MEQYLFYGKILPERAQLSLEVALRFKHHTSARLAQAKVRILLNQLAVWIESEDEWDIFDLRNVVLTIVMNELAMVGYLKGYAYEIEVTRVLNQSRGIDLVFGIDVPCLAELRTSDNLDASLMKLREKLVGLNGMFLHRCLNDLISSLKNANDTGFYCYRAIESLRHHCAAVNGLSNDEKAKQWEKFREISGADEDTIRTVKVAADPLRHGEFVGMTSDERAKLLTATWKIVDRYLNSVQPSRADAALG